MVKIKLSKMKNIGTEIEKKLNSVGIMSADELSNLGSKEAFVRLKAKYPETCLVHLYSLYGAINELDFNVLPEEVKEDLKSFNNSLK